MWWRKPLMVKKMDNGMTNGWYENEIVLLMKSEN